MPNEDDMLVSALNYGERGWSVFPLYGIAERDGVRRCSCGRSTCDHQGKHPAISGGFTSATTDQKKIRRWFSLPGRNLGIATGCVSGISIIDIDPKNGGDESLEGLENEFGLLPETPRVLTGGGGEHIFFACPTKPLACSVGKIAIGIDVRSDGGYIVAPPSLHIDGPAYRWLEGYHPDLLPFAEMPDWLLKLASYGKLEPRKIQPNRFEPTNYINGDRIREGTRNNTLTRLSGHLIANRIDLFTVRDLVFAVNQAYCEPPLERREVEGLVSSIAWREVQKRKVGHDNG